MKTTELDPTKNYLFIHHPHGFISLSSIINFATEATGFSMKFPGVHLTPLTLPLSFKMPFIRDLFIFWGAGSVSNKNCDKILSSNYNLI